MLKCSYFSQWFSLFSLRYQVQCIFKVMKNTLKGLDWCQKSVKLFGCTYFLCLSSVHYIFNKAIVISKAVFLCQLKKLGNLQTFPNNFSWIGRKPVIGFPLNGCSDIYSLLMSLLLIFFALLSAVWHKETGFREIIIKSIFPLNIRFISTVYRAI